MLLKIDLRSMEPPEAYVIVLGLSPHRGLLRVYLRA